MKTNVMRTLCLISFFLISGICSRADTPGISDQPGLIVVNDVFQFLEGSWAQYDVQDHVNERDYTMRISMLNPERVRRRLFSRRRDYHWMEIDIQLPDEPRVITKVLTKVTPEGPGEMHRAIVKIDGFDHPIALSRRRLRASEGDIIKPDMTLKEEKLEQREIIHQGRSLNVWTVKAEDEEGNVTTVIISEELPPFGLYSVESPQLKMTLSDWGTGATSAIEGRPLGLIRWILHQIISVFTSS